VSENIQNNTFKLYVPNIQTHSYAEMYYDTQNTVLY